MTTPALPWCFSTLLRRFTTRCRCIAHPGQSLVEFTFGIPVLLLIMLAAYGVGAAMYSGANAHWAMQAPLQNTFNYANTTNAEGMVIGDIMGPTMGSWAVGANVDSVTFETRGAVMARMVGRKQYTPPVPFVPNFNFTVVSVIPDYLLTPNNGPEYGIPQYPFAGNEGVLKRLTPGDGEHFKTQACLNRGEGFEWALDANGNQVPLTYCGFTAGIPQTVPMSNSCAPSLGVFGDVKVIHPECAKKATAFADSQVDKTVDPTGWQTVYDTFLRDCKILAGSYILEYLLRPPFFGVMMQSCPDNTGVEGTFDTAMKGY